MPSFLLKILSALVFLAYTNSNVRAISSLQDYVKCNMCESVQLEGTVDDCCCDFQTVDNESKTYFQPLLDEIISSRFFRYFKVNLWKECPFWDEDGLCFNSGCSVCECEESEVPTTFIEDDKKMCEEVLKECNEKIEGLGDLDRDGAEVGTDLAGWTEKDNADLVWTDEDHNDKDMVYVNLLKNPEGYTGYGGASARKVWMKLHEENCFFEEGMKTGTLCLEQRVFYRLISGMQSSISTHVALKWLTDDLWHPNIDFFVDKVGRWEDRVENMYFLYLFLLRAVARAEDALLHYDYDTGVPGEGDHIRSLMRQLVSSSSSCPAGDAVASSSPAGQPQRLHCLAGFDETAMFRVPAEGMSDLELHLFLEEKERLRSQLRAKFKTISQVMDCVGCEKCKMWGKLQTLGIGTALKILFTPPGHPLPPLQRNEVVALVHTLGHIGQSVGAVQFFKQSEVEEALAKVYFGSALAAAGVLLFVLLVRLCVKRSPARVSQAETKAASRSSSAEDLRQAAASSSCPAASAAADPVVWARAVADMGGEEAAAAHAAKALTAAGKVSANNGTLSSHANGVVDVARPPADPSSSAHWEVLGMSAEEWNGLSPLDKVRKEQQALVLLRSAARGDALGAKPTSVDGTNAVRRRKTPKD